MAESGRRRRQSVYSHVVIEWGTYGVHIIVVLGDRTGVE